MTILREPAVAGTFYPDDASTLRTMITNELQAVHASGPVPKAIIAPHAGYVYSGPVAASAYARLVQAHGTMTRVVLLGPAHWLPLHGLAASRADAFVTPLGRIPVEQDAITAVCALPQVHVFDEAHVPEHSLEVQLPFLQVALETFTLVPLVVGEATPAEVGEVLNMLWAGPETLIVISSDLSHYHDYDIAQQLDRETSRAIQALRAQDIGVKHACGYIAINGLLHVARQRDMRVEIIDLRNSGDTAGPRDSVVGYGAYAFTE